MLKGFYRLESTKEKMRVARIQETKKQSITILIGLEISSSSHLNHCGTSPINVGLGEQKGKELQTKGLRGAKSTNRHNSSWCRFFQLRTDKVVD